MLNTRYYALFVAVIVLVAAAVLAKAPPQHTASALFVVLLLSLVVCTLFLGHALFPNEPLDVDSSMPNDEESMVDPWRLQRQLMAISAQDLPDFPVLSKHGLMYAALIAEESGETFQGLVEVLDRILEDSLTAPASGGARLQRSEETLLALRTIRGSLRMLAFELGKRSVDIRHALAALPNFHEALLKNEAITILDGTTDIAVVNCGFALASGLPGAQGYEEVGDSNLSKANPETGVIDKHPDGKWIKGRLYRAPNLESVLTEHYAGGLLRR